MTEGRSIEVLVGSGMFVLIFFFCRTMYACRTCVGNILKAMRGIVIEHAGRATIISDFAQMWRESGHFKVDFKRLNALMFKRLNA